MLQRNALVRWAVLRSLLCWLTLSSVFACSHTEPSGPQTFDTDQPFDPSPPIRLTLHRGPDRGAAWLPDGSAILYSTQLGGDDPDVCLAALPPTGGRQHALTCTFTTAGSKLVEALEPAAASSDGSLAFLAASSRGGLLVPDKQELVVGSLENPSAHRALLAVPYTVAGHPIHSGLSQLRWLGPTRLVFLAEAVNVVTPCAACESDTVRSGRNAVWLTTQGGGSSPQIIPGTTNASGVTPGSGEDEVYYTIAGDTRVYRQQLSTGQTSIVYDFGAQGVARDVHVVGTRMTAIVGGRVHFVDDPSLGPTQWDSGGIIHVVGLEDGSDVALDDPAGLFRRPQLSPDASRIIAERFQVDLTEQGAFVHDNGDLYLFGQP